MFWLKMAWAQLMRRRLRTGILVGALSLAYAVLLFFRGLADEGYDQLADMLVRTRFGHVVISARGYTHDPRPEAILPDVRALRSLIPRDVRVEERIFFSGLLRSPGQVAYFQGGIAMDWPDAFEHAGLMTREAASRLPRTGAHVVIGRDLATKLAVTMDDRVVLQLEGPFGTIEHAVHVADILSTGDPAIDRGAVFVSLDVVRGWFHMPWAAHQIALFSSAGTADALVDQLLSQLVDLPEATTAEVLTWRQSLPMAAQFIDYHSWSVWLFQFIIFFIIAVSLIDAFFMSMFERTREHGILRALGMGRLVLMRQVAVESLLLGLLAGCIGLALGTAAIFYGAVIGVDPAWFTGEPGIEVAGGVFSGRIHARFPWSTFVWSWFALLALTVTATLIPALRATTVDPVKALRR